MKESKNKMNEWFLVGIKWNDSIEKESFEFSTTEDFTIPSPIVHYHSVSPSLLSCPCTLDI